MTLTDITVVEQDFIEIISLLDPNKAVGPYRISNKMHSEVIYDIAGRIF
jgi:glucan biosynthesis protein